MPITAGPHEIVVFQRTGPANRTAKPLSVVLPLRTLMAVDHGGSDGAWSNTRVALAVRRQGDGSQEHQRPVHAVRPLREHHGPVLLHERLEVVAGPGFDA